MCAALLAEWWRGEYSNSIVYVVIDETVQSLLGVVGRGGRCVGICRQQLFGRILCCDEKPSVACRVASAVADVLSEGESALADGVVLRPGERDRDCYDDDGADDVVERRRGAVSAGSWYVRADNAIRMGDAGGGGGGGGVCTGGERCRGMRFGRAKHASWRGGLLVLGGGGGGVEGGGAAASIFTLYRRRRVRLYTDDGSGGRGGLLKCALTV